MDVGEEATNYCLHVTLRANTRYTSGSHFHRIQAQPVHGKTGSGFLLGHSLGGKCDR